MKNNNKNNGNDQNKGNSGDHGNNTVEIKVNNNPYSIHRGKQSVKTIKTTRNVALADKLEQVIDGKLVPLEDDGSVVIKGGEEFKSHIPSGGAS